MLTISNQATQDNYVAALTLESRIGGKALAYTVANASVLAQFKPLPQLGGSETSEWSAEVLLVPQQGSVQAVAGCRFRSAVAGSPARIIAQLSEPGDFVPAQGSAYSGVLAAGGGASNPPGVSAYYKDGALIGNESGLNFITPVGLGLTVVDNPGLTRVDVTYRGQVSRLATGAFPPAGPQDGDLVSLKVSANVDWLFVYDAATAYWHFIGGPPLLSTVAANEARSNAAYGDLATVGPSVTVPRLGDYIADVAAFMTMTGSANTGFMSFAVNAAAATDGRAAAGQAGLATFEGTGSRKTALTLAINDVLTAKYRGNTAAQIDYSDRVISVLPVRIQ